VIAKELEILWLGGIWRTCWWKSGCNLEYAQ